MVSKISSAILNYINWLTTPQDHVCVVSVSVAYVAHFLFYHSNHIVFKETRDSLIKICVNTYLIDIHEHPESQLNISYSTEVIADVTNQT